MKKVFFAMALVLLPVCAQPADYNVYIRPHGYYIPQVNTNINPTWQYQQNAQQYLMQQQMMQMNQQQIQQQMYMQQQLAQQRQQIMAWQNS